MNSISFQKFLKKPKKKLKRMRNFMLAWKFKIKDQKDYSKLVST